MRTAAPAQRRTALVVRAEAAAPVSRRAALGMVAGGEQQPFALVPGLFNFRMAP